MNEQEIRNYIKGLQEWLNQELNPLNFEIIKSIQSEIKLFEGVLRLIGADVPEKINGLLQQEFQAELRYKNQKFIDHFAYLNNKATRKKIDGNQEESLLNFLKMQDEKN